MLPAVLHQLIETGRARQDGQRIACDLPYGRLAVFTDLTTRGLPVEGSWVRVTVYAEDQRCLSCSDHRNAKEALQALRVK